MKKQLRTRNIRKPIRCMRETKVREIFQKGKNFENTKDLLLIFSEVEQDSKKNRKSSILKNDQRIRSISWKLKLWYINEKSI